MATKTFLGLSEIMLLIAGIIIFWGEPWSIVTLIFLIADVCYAAYLVYKENKAKQELEDATDDLMTEIFKALKNKDGKDES